jgi:hypothetical protein
MEHKDAIGTDKPIEIDVMDADIRLTTRNKVLISKQPIEGAGEATTVGKFYGTPIEGKWYVKILEEIEAAD